MMRSLEACWNGLLAPLVLVGCASGPGTPATAPAGAGLALTSPAFAPGGAIPTRYTCRGRNLSPPLAWSGVPAGTDSLVVFVYDRDAGPNRGASVEAGFVHWLIFNLPPALTGLAEGAPDGGEARQAANDFAGMRGGQFPGGEPVRGHGYEGPCPPARHRYVFRLMALGTTLDLPEGASPAQVMRAMQGRVLAQAELEAAYAPPG